jgi:hypothetical protein
VAADLARGSIEEASRKHRGGGGMWNPDETIRAARAIAQHIQALEQGCSARARREARLAEAAGDLAELWLVLDRYLAGGGASPQEWRRDSSQRKMGQEG